LPIDYGPNKQSVMKQLNEELDQQHKKVSDHW